ncbi:MAG: hypothetical protein ACYCQI_01585 [Gammaproteobacteria bacterium]
MRKLVIALATLFLSLNAYATTTLPHHFGTAILNATKQHADVKIIKTSFPMVYGGQDISRSRVAIADVSVWAGQRTLIG